MVLIDCGDLIEILQTNQLYGINIILIVARLASCPFVMVYNLQFVEELHQ